MTPASPTLPIHSLPGPKDITRETFANGMVVLSRANYNSPSVVITGYLPAGGIYDPQDKLGLANFTATSLMRGTQQQDFHQIFDTLESCAASLGFGGGVHSIGFSGKALAEDLDLLLSLFAQALRQPVFPNDQVERLRAQALTSLAIMAQDTAHMAALTFDQLVYAGHPYSRPEEGTPQTIQAIEQTDLVDFHRRHYGPRGLALAIVGAVDPEQAVEKTARALGDWQNPLQPLPAELPALTRLEQRTTRQVSIPGKSQADLLIGAAGPARASMDFMPAMVGNNILGQFGMMGRIGEAVRERAGLAYYAASHLSGGTGPGPWSMSAGVDPENISKVIDLVIEEIQRFTSEPVSADELADSKSDFVGHLPLSLESNAGVASALINLERHQLGLDYYYRYAGLINAVSVKQIMESAQQYLDPDRLGIAVAGP